MGITSENLAEKYNITRLESDKYSLQSQKRWKHGIFYLIIIFNI